MSRNAAVQHRAASLAASFSIRITQLKVPSSPTSSSALSATSHFNTVCSGCSNGTPVGIFESLGRCDWDVHRSGQLRTALLVEDRRSATASTVSTTPATLTTQQRLRLGDERTRRGRVPTRPPPAHRRGRAPDPTSCKPGTSSTQCHEEDAMTASALASGNGIDSPRPSTTRTAGTASVRTDRIRASGSTAVTSSTWSTRSRERAPVPAPRSTTIRAPSGRIHATASTGGPGRYRS